MLIRTRIFLTLITFLLVVFLIGISFSFFGSKQIGYINIIERYIEARELVKTISNIFSEQIRAYDYYVYLHEDSEKHTFNEKKNELLKRLEIGKNLDIERLNFTKEHMDLFNNLAARSFRIINSKGRSSAIKKTEKSILSEIEKIREELEILLIETEKQLNNSRKIALSYKKRVEYYFILICIFGIVVLSVISIDLYRTITGPLKKMEQAATIIGQGNLNYKIEIKTRNEFLSIADAFNKMAGDLKEFHLKVTQMGKMAAIGELAGGVAHEINNPLTGILGNVQILTRKFPSGHEAYQMLMKIERAAIRCRNIVSDLLDFSRKEEVETEAELIEVSKVIDNTLTFCEAEILSKNIKLVREYSTDILNVEVSCRLIQQAFLNIINNAMQAMPDGGKIVISTEKVEIENEYLAQIQFKDTGKGFDDETAKHLFEPFFTTRGIGEGTGLGLSLTYRIIKNNNGFISAKTENGAVFTVRLPLIT
ncbi:MAG: HAMP domain-containing protein [PVC group bacterium]|nr:HAMP domain-containing protein [PVC group bacterium]